MLCGYPHPLISHPMCQRNLSLTQRNPRFSHLHRRKRRTIHRRRGRPIGIIRKHRQRPIRRRRPRPIGIRGNRRPNMRPLLSNLRQRRVTTTKRCGGNMQGVERRKKLYESKKAQREQSRKDSDRYFDAIIDYVCFILNSLYPICTATRPPLFLTLKTSVAVIILGIY